MGFCYYNIYGIWALNRVFGSLEPEGKGVWASDLLIGR